MSDNTMPERVWCNWDYKDGLGATEYIRADVAADARIDAERKRIVDAVDAILNWQSGYERNVIAAAIKAAVWNDKDDPREILAREVKHMETTRWRQ